MKLKLIPLILFLSVCIGHAAGDGSIDVMFTVSEPALIRNDHVGNDWATDMYVIYQKKKYPLLGTASNPVKITVRRNSGFRIKALASEHDKSPDYGSRVTYIKVSDLLKNGPVKYELIVNIRENRGRYSGRLAQWKFTVEVRCLNVGDDK